MIVSKEVFHDTYFFRYNLKQEIETAFYEIGVSILKTFKPAFDGW